VVFSDEKMVRVEKFSRKLVWITKGFNDHVQYIHKGAAGRLTTMVWGSMVMKQNRNCFVGKLRKLTGKQNADTYIKLLEKALQEEIYQGRNGSVIFQQDNCPYHKSYKTMRFLKAALNPRNVKVLAWPPRSPDLSPIEFMWGKMERFMDEYKLKVHNQADLDRLVALAFKQCSTKECMDEYRRIAIQNMLKCVKDAGGNKYSE
jgi:transposase